MKINTKIPQTLAPHFHMELELYRSFLAAGDYSGAWYHLERAHVIGQAYPWPHTYVHWLMLKFGIKIKDRKEILGQLPRLMVGGVKSFVGKIPVGNTGGANVPPLRPMPIANDIQEILKAAEKPGETIQNS